MSATRKRPLRGGPRIQAVAGQAEGGQPPEQPGKRLTTSAMIASLAGPDQRTKPAPFGHALVEIAKDRPEIVGMTADLSKYTDLHIFAKEFPDRFYQMGMAEQLLMLSAAGMAHEGFVPFVTTYAVFASRRTYDFVSQGIAEEGLNVKICCALPGLTTGYGPSHQATEDVAIFRGMPDLTIVDPCDALDTEQATRAIAAHDGPVYMRLLRGNVPLVLDEYDYAFELGKAKLVRDGGDALVVSSGIMTMRALETAKLLEKDRVNLAVLHVPTIKPLDEETILREAGRGGRLVVVAENHTIMGGLGEAVAAALLRAGVHAEVPAGGVAGRVPGRGRAADAARPLRHLGRGDGEEHQGMAVAGSSAPRAGATGAEARDGATRTGLPARGQRHHEELRADEGAARGRFRRRAGRNPRPARRQRRRASPRCSRSSPGTETRDGGSLLYKGHRRRQPRRQASTVWRHRGRASGAGCTAAPERGREHRPSASPARLVPVQPECGLPGRARVARPDRPRLCREGRGRADRWADAARAAAGGDRAALKSGAQLLLLDEPTANLTAGETERLFEVLRRLTAESRDFRRLRLAPDARDPPDRARLHHHP